MSGTASDSDAYQLTFAYAPGAVSTFPYTGVTGARSDLTTTDRVNGVAEPPSVTSLYYDAVTFAPIGQREVTDDACSTAVAGPALPTDAVIGAEGTLYTLTDYLSCTPPSTSEGVSEVMWSLESEAGNVLFCQNVTIRNRAGGVFSTETLCLQVAPDGTLGPKARATITEGNFSLVARN